MQNRDSYTLDLKVEAELSKFTDKYVYAELSSHIPGFEFLERNSDMELQRKGVDVFASINGQNVTIDEKASTDWIDRDLPTFALELHYFLGNNQKVGWLLDESKVNDYLLLITKIRTIRPVQHRDKDKVKRRQALESFTESQVIDLEVFLVQKSKLWDYLNSMGITREYLKSVVSWVSAGNYLPNDLPGGLKFSIPGTMEGGLSLLLPLSEWHKISDKHLLVSRNPLYRQVLK